MKKILSYTLFLFLETILSALVAMIVLFVNIFFELILAVLLLGEAYVQSALFEYGPVLFMSLFSANIAVVIYLVIALDMIVGKRSFRELVKLSREEIQDWKFSK